MLGELKKAFDYNIIKGFFCNYFAVRTGLSHLYVTQLITRQNFNVPQYVPPCGVNNMLVIVLLLQP